MVGLPCKKTKKQNRFQILNENCNMIKNILSQEIACTLKTLVYTVKPPLSTPQYKIPSFMWPSFKSQFLYKPYKFTPVERPPPLCDPFFKVPRRSHKGGFTVLVTYIQGPQPVKACLDREVAICFDALPRSDSLRLAWREESSLSQASDAPETFSRQEVF